MEFVKEVLNDPVTKVLAILAVFYAIKELITNWEWVKQRVDKKYKEKNADENEKKDLESKVGDIAIISEQHTETFAQIGEALDGINIRLDEMEKERNEDIIANGRATMYHLYEEMKDKQTLTMSDYETFNAIATRYLAAGGNSVFKDKIIPEIRNKPIDDD